MLPANLRAWHTASGKISVEVSKNRLCKRLQNCSAERQALTGDPKICARTPPPHNEKEE